MANEGKQALSRNLADMKFMKRRSGGKLDMETDGVLTDKWIVPNAPDPIDPSTFCRTVSSFVECADLNRLGRFSYNGHNKETERLMAAYQKKEGAEEGEVLEEDEDEETIRALEVNKRFKDIGVPKKILGKRRRT